MMVLSTKRPWNWKVFLVLVGLIIPAAFANGPGCLPKYYANALLTLEVAASRSIFAAHLFAKSNRERDRRPIELHEHFGGDFVSTAGS